VSDSGVQSGRDRDGGVHDVLLRLMWRVLLTGQLAMAGRRVWHGAGEIISLAIVFIV